MLIYYKYTLKLVEIVTANHCNGIKLVGLDKII